MGLIVYSGHCDIPRKKKRFRIQTIFHAIYAKHFRDFIVV